MTPPTAPKAGGEGGPSPFRSAWRWLPLVLLALASGAVVVSGIHRWVGLDALMESRAWLHGAVAEDRPRAVAAAMLLYVASVVVSVPATLVLTMLCGFLFGTVTGALMAIASATTGAAIVFSIGRHAARNLILARAGPRIARFAEGFRRDAFGYVAFLRLLPLFPFWLTNLGPAAFGVPLRTFVLATLVGLTPGAFVYAATGAGLEDVFGAHEAALAACRATGETACSGALELHRLVTPKMVGALLALAAFALISVFLRRRLERRTRTA